MPSARQTSLLLTVSVVVIVAALCYSGCYVAMIDTGRIYVIHVSSSGIWPRAPAYRIDHPLVHRLFWPVHMVDRRLRPFTWLEQRWMYPEHYL
ncbi:hypothetical protein ACFL59_11410 [Planctomycetota bacterium]